MSCASTLSYFETYQVSRAASLNKGFQNQACICVTFLYSEEVCHEKENPCKLTSSTVTNYPNYRCHRHHGCRLWLPPTTLSYEHVNTNKQDKMYTSWPPFKSCHLLFKKCSATIRKSYIHKQMLIKCCKSYEHRLLLNNCYGKNTASLVL